MRKIIHLVLAAAMLSAVAGVAHGSPATSVWEDPSGDADNAQGVGASIPGGFDLIEGSIAKNKKNLEFTVTHADMPPSGTIPEAFRFLWAFSVDDKNYRLTVKSADIGKPDVAAGQTTERVGRVDVTGHFRLEDECTRDDTLPVGFINCPPLEYLEGTWDPASMSFTVIVPLKSIKAKKGSVIMGGAGETASICQICWVSHYAERSLNTSVIDTAVMVESYKVPKK
ncbi:MAG: hypothetical protein ACR2KQ_00790 [Actinomycetota bacterium]